MKRVYTADNRAMAWHVRNVLASNAVEAEVRNDILRSAQGPVPVNECNPEVWILHDGDEETVRQLLDEIFTAPLEETSWQCDNCGETNYGQFDICWNCQSESTLPE
jgi:hypothetical protein